jgi:glutamate formiminotransferase/formiminotetrahydrofolate cyclodeaminase
LGASLGTMAAYLTYGNRKYEKLDSQIREVLPEFYKIQNDLMKLIDQDAIAFNLYVVSELKLHIKLSLIQF